MKECVILTELTAKLLNTLIKKLLVHGTVTDADETRKKEAGCRSACLLFPGFVFFPQDRIITRVADALVVPVAVAERTFIFHSALFHHFSGINISRIVSGGNASGLY